MDANRIRNVMSRVVLGTIVVFATAFVMPEAAEARVGDHRYSDDYDGVRWDREREKRYAYLLGYHTGYSEGRDTRGHGVRYKDMPNYRDGMNGYLAWMGSRDTYRDYYRKGYEDGFKDAEHLRPRRYDRDDVERVLGDSLKRVYSDPYYGDRRGHGRGNGRGNGWPNGRDDHYGRYSRDQVYRIAQQNGYRDGYQHGQQDRARRRGYDYDHEGRYRDATSGYRSEYGDRELYRQGYRDGYRRGYDDGYRQSGSRGRWPF